ncbi:hypothetical protein INT43_000412 [Umbelopsis isabellina]|uniref:RING-type domain-containing protein n=1 Tax=Mortierella isabellina TaxID=91625 RepID=A0A8H7Q231_MORIS|nr:hypothetical protein INT43_000412 [Umbelopsis isabellina]
MFSRIKLLSAYLTLLSIPIVYGQTVANPVFQIQNWVGFTSTSITNDNLGLDEVAFSLQFQTINVGSDYNSADHECGTAATCGPRRYVVNLDYACNATFNATTLEAANGNVFAAAHNISHKAVGLISRGGNCNWTEKVTIAQSIAAATQLPLDAIIIYDNQRYTNYTDDLLDNTGPIQPPTYGELPADQNATTMFDNDLNVGALTMAVYFASNEFGQALAQNVSIASTNSMNNTNKQIWVWTPILGYSNDNSFSTMLAASKGYLSYIIGLAAIFLVGAILLRWWRIRRLREQMAQRGDLEPGIAMRNRHPKVHPLPVDILNTYPVESYSPEKIKNNSCAICLDDFLTDKNTVRVLPCRHGFCTGCIDPWLTDKSPYCPICKYDCLPAELREHANLVEQNPVLGSSSPFTTPSAAAAAALATDDESTNHSIHSAPPPPFEEHQPNTNEAESSEHAREASTLAATATPNNLQESNPSDSNPTDSKPAAA